MKIKTGDNDNIIISKGTVELKNQCSAYTLTKCTLKFFKQLEKGKLAFVMDWPDAILCTYDIKDRKVSAEAFGKNISGYVNLTDGNDVIFFSLSVSNYESQLSDKDYITFTHNLTDNNVMVCFKNTAGEITLQNTIWSPEGALEIEFCQDHDYEFLFYRENDFTIYDKTVGCQLYPYVEGYQLNLSGSTAFNF